MKATRNGWTIEGTPEEIRRMMNTGQSKTRTGKKKKLGRKRAKQNKHWTEKDIKYVKDTMNEPQHIVAKDLGRTKSAIANARSRVRVGEL